MHFFWETLTLGRTVLFGSTSNFGWRLKGTPSRAAERERRSAEVSGGAVSCTLSRVSGEGREEWTVSPPPSVWCGFCYLWFPGCCSRLVCPGRPCGGCVVSGSACCCEAPGEVEGCYGDKHEHNQTKRIKTQQQPQNTPIVLHNTAVSILNVFTRHLLMLDVQSNDKSATLTRDRANRRERKNSKNWNNIWNSTIY